MDDQNHQSGGGPASTSQKMAIPRLERWPPPEGTESARRNRHRVKKACANCRERKAKCTGDIPSCRNCFENGINCVYPQGRIDRLKEAIEHKEQLTALLRDLSYRADGRDKEKIQEVLDAVGDTKTARTDSSTSLGKRSISGFQSDEDVDTPVPDSVEYNIDPDLLGEGLRRNSDSRILGTVEQHMGIQWLASRTQQLEVERNTWARRFENLECLFHALRHGTDVQATNVLARLRMGERVEDIAISLRGPQQNRDVTIDRDAPRT